MSLVIHLAGKLSIVLLAIKYFCIFMPTSGSHEVLQISKVLLSQLWMSTDIVLIYPLRCFFADQALCNFVVFGLFLEFFSLLFSGDHTNSRDAEVHSETSAAGTSLVRLTWLEFRPTAETYSGTSLGCLNQKITFGVINPYYTEVFMWNCFWVNCSQPILF